MLNTNLFHGTPFQGDLRCDDAFELDLEQALSGTVIGHCRFAASTLDGVKANELSAAQRLLEIETARLAGITALEAFAALKLHGNASSTNTDILANLAWQAWDIAMEGVTPSNNELTSTDARLAELDATDKLVEIVERTTSVIDKSGPWSTGLFAGTIVLTNRLGAVCCDPLLFIDMSLDVDRRTEMAISNKAAPILARLYNLSKSLERANIRPE